MRTSLKSLVSICCILVASYSFSQNDKGDITLAPQIGLNLSTYSSEASFNTRAAFAAGAIVEFYFSDRWSLRSGLLFDPMGAEDVFNNTDKLSYLTLPIHANWHFGRNRNWYLNFGPAVAFLLDGKGELSNGATVDISDVVNSTDFGLSIGIGYKFQVSENIQLVVDYQGYGGFIDIVGDNNNPFSIRNSRSAFNVGAVFQL